ncbi:hypothetical protein ZIOFF_049186 [Zingiber officinale]|uniref:beta-N-acetylhexosaminidase n=1 Tax=Zingiber officinale TaxID=94328 RepID=A0A8J5FXS6_ZINOF|nr:hypothetical protein ZIOFF_049186 [Zingiber officinale]
MFTCRSLKGRLPSKCLPNSTRDPIQSCWFLATVPNYYNNSFTTPQFQVHRHQGTPIPSSSAVSRSSTVMPSEAVCFLLLILLSLLTPPSHGRSIPRRSIPRRHWIPSTNDSPVYLWPLPKQFSHGDGILYVDPDLSLDLQVPGDYLEIVTDAFERYKDLIFTHWERSARRSSAEYDVAKMTVIVSSTNDTLQFGVDESYMLYVGRGDELSVVKGATIEANTIYGALRGLETFSQLCIPNYENKSVEIQKAPWSIKDEPRFNFRGLLIDTSRHYLPVNVIKQVIDAMSYAKLNVLHWHILDEESFPLEVPSYPNLWKGSYSKLERYTIEDAYEVVE